MQQLNVYDFYELGKRTADIESRVAKIETAVPLSTLGWPLFLLRWALEGALREPCALLPASRRAVKALIIAIDNIIPDNFHEAFGEGTNKTIETFQLGSIKHAISSFETILKNDMPEMSTFAVNQIGILRTDDLINNAYKQIASQFRDLLPEKAKDDIVEAGRCLAFRVSTASAFHSCRAVESCIDLYYEAVTGSPYQVSANGGNNNWGAKTEALSRAAADQKVTEFLTHIRKQYRNPVTHPDVVVEEHEAVDLFVASLSAISMMLGAAKQIQDKNQPLLKGLAEGFLEAGLVPLPESAGNKD